MKKTRRDFLKQTGLAAAAVAATGAFTPTKSYGGLLATRPVEMPPDDTVRALMMTAINNRDYPLVQGCVLTFALSYVLVNAITDLVYSAADPRIRLG